MDKSDQYIKMCNCPEIQGKKVAIRDKDNFVYIEIKKRAYYIWLPRQDHIQEMLIDKSTSAYRLLETFWEFVHNNWQSIWEVLPEHPSLEQLWLAFYMYEKHGKTWDDKGWIK